MALRLSLSEYCVKPTLASPISVFTHFFVALRVMSCIYLTYYVHCLPHSQTLKGRAMKKKKLATRGSANFKELWLQDEKHRESFTSNNVKATCKMWRKASKLGRTGIKAVESNMKAGIRKNTAPMELFLSAATSIGRQQPFRT